MISMDLTVLAPLFLLVMSLYAFTPPYKKENGEREIPTSSRVGWFLFWTIPALVLCILNGHFGWSPVQ